ncbi:MAG: heme lyase CcmF/NrfE family subunit [Gammaproteobacteria bacterium]|nr:heme lyase CcmF/NrfE family subunit [Candidatus Thioaporhodococcus sediminis]TNF52838.1 MAG: heme lyase CcmF/NrfE family subunit [Gammaproteobacteria bacterium]
MIPELGHFALILALGLALIQAILPLAGSYTGNLAWMSTARPLAWGQFVFTAIAFALLLLAFLTDDFSVVYVASNSNTLMPTIYKVSAVWGAHEGSLLLWAGFLAAWGAAVAGLSRNIPLQVLARILAVMGMVGIGFLLFMLLTSNPFERIFPPPLEGRDLNPLLQDPGLAIHPPLLYMGYVGFSVAFAFAIAALLGGKLDAAWARWSRPWTTTAWIFLTLGIALGSWWAYYELGWGGWWFWDPVENASLMPWLAGTALMHSLAVTEKRGAFKSWTVLLAITAFSLSLLGTFLVRSGVLTSVHAFATDPARGTFILIFLCIVIGGSLALYAWRAPAVSGGGRFDLLSRESFLLANNLLLTLLTALILLGTLAPLIYEAMAWGKISVGFPWFNTMFVAVTPFLALLMGIGPMTRWKQDEPGRLARELRVPFILTGAASLLTVFLMPLLSLDWYLVPLGIGLAVWLLTAHIQAIRERLRHKNSPSAILRDLATNGRSFYGMILAHLGVAMFVVGVTMVANYGQEKDVRMSPGDSQEVAGYRFLFHGVRTQRGPNYMAMRGHFQIFDGEKPIADLWPEKRNYFASQKPMTEASIDWGFTRDLYVSLGEPLEDGDWALRLYYKPYVRWIWLGAVLMALGGLLAITDRRYRLARGLTRASADVAGATATARS